ncbi:MAG: Hsp20 family protein [Proteobacteria bacterium]|nr:Hsp20 family protein [Pseudomonadota bacterium]
MTTFDLSPLWRTTVGFDEFDRLFDTVFSSETKTNTYPPYNIVKTDKNNYQITMAVAGFDESNINISLEENLLVIKGDNKSGNDLDENVEYLHRGIATRNFERRFEIADTVKVNEADLKNGLLVIGLEREIPEHKKPRKIEISSNSKTISA